MTREAKTMREQFEKWAIERHGWNKAHAQSRLLHTPDNERYSDVLTQQKWEAYRAGAEAQREWEQIALKVIRDGLAVERPSDKARVIDRLENAVSRSAPIEGEKPCSE